MFLRLSVLSLCLALALADVGDDGFGDPVPYSYGSDSGLAPRSPPVASAPSNPGSDLRRFHFRSKTNVRNTGVKGGSGFRQEATKDVPQVIVKQETKGGSFIREETKGGHARREETKTVIKQEATKSIVKEEATKSIVKEEAKGGSVQKREPEQTKTIIRQETKTIKQEATKGGDVYQQKDESTKSIRQPTKTIVQQPAGKTHVRTWTRTFYHPIPKPTFKRVEPPKPPVVIRRWVHRTPTKTHFVPQVQQQAQDETKSIAFHPQTPQIYKPAQEEQSQQEEQQEQAQQESQEEQAQQETKGQETVKEVQEEANQQEEQQEQDSVKQERKGYLAAAASVPVAVVSAPEAPIPAPIFHAPAPITVSLLRPSFVAAAVPAAVYRELPAAAPQRLVPVVNARSQLRSPDEVSPRASDGKRWRGFGIGFNA